MNSYEVDNHLFNSYIQLGFLTTASLPVSIQDLSWSHDGATWTNFGLQSVKAGDGNTLGYSDIVALGSVIGRPFYVRYTIPTAPVNPLGTFAEGDFVSSQLFSNRDGSTRMTFDASSMTTLPVLRGSPGNRYALVQRDHEDAPASVPGPLAVMGVIAGLRSARQLRRERQRFTQRGAVGFG